jgi:hypothetical protein
VIFDKKLIRIAKCPFNTALNLGSIQRTRSPPLGAQSNQGQYRKPIDTAYFTSPTPHTVPRHLVEHFSMRLDAIACDPPLRRIVFIWFFECDILLN